MNYKSLAIRQFPGRWKNTVTIHFDRLIFPVGAIPTLQFKISVSAKPIKAQARHGKKGII